MKIFRHLVYICATATLFWAITTAPAQTTEKRIAREQADLEKKRAEIERKSAELQQKESEIERARQALQKPAERPLTQYEFVRLEREKAEHIKRAVRMAKRGFERIEKRWDEREAADSKAENLTAATLDRHDTIIRRNLGMNESPERPCAVNLSVLSGGRAVVQVNQKKEQQ